MFAELGNDTERLWLLALLGCWAVLLFGGFIFGRLNAAGTNGMPTWTRMASSITLVVVAWSGFVFVQESGAASFALLIAIGMTLGCVGDFFMAKLIPVKEPVLGGIGSFGLGHIAYIIAFLNFGNQQGLNALSPRLGAWIFWLLAGAVGWYVVVYQRQKHSALHYAALPYALLLASTAGFATGLAVQSSAFILPAVGTALFLLSDLLLAAQLFNDLHFKMIGDVVWLLYGPAQMLIVYSLAAVLVVIR